MPSRIDSFRQALPSILNQVDQLHIYFDQYDAVPPEFLGKPKMIVHLNSGHFPDLGCGGKFLGLRTIVEPSLYFTFDDDIIYPNNYVQYLRAALERLHYEGIVGLHASVFQYKPPSYHINRRILNFSDPLEADSLVDELGTGTVAFLTSLISFDPFQWPAKNISDLMLMVHAVAHNIPRVAIRRPKDFLVPIDYYQADSVYLATSRNDHLQTKIINGAMNTYPNAWIMSPVDSHTAS